MRSMTRSLLAAGGLLGGLLLLLEAPPAGAGHEPFGTYEDWANPTIRPDRWAGATDLGQENRTEVRRGSLRMRYRKEGATGSDTGLTGFFSTRLNLLPALNIDQVEAGFKVRALAVTGCPPNPSASLARAAALDLNRFNDLPGPPVPGDLTGDHIARVGAQRFSNSPDPPGIMDIVAFLFRCNNAPCTSSTTIAGPVTLGQRAVRKTFSVRMIWDSPGSRFRAGLDGDPEQDLAYPPAANARPANVPFALVRVQHFPANCTMPSGGPTVGDAETKVLEVRTNVSGIIP